MADPSARMPTTDRSKTMWAEVQRFRDFPDEWAAVWFDLVGGDEFCEYLYSISNNEPDAFNQNGYLPSIAALLSLKLKCYDAEESHKAFWVGRESRDREALIHGILLSHPRDIEVLDLDTTDLERAFVLITQFPHADWEQIVNFIDMDMDSSIIASFRGLSHE